VLAALERATTPLLIVIDYAETRVDQVEELVERLSESSRGASTRVVLLAREAGDWWDQLPQGYSTPTVGPLGPLEATVDGRRAAFEDAVDAFAARTGRSSFDIVEPDLSEPLFANALFLHIAALSSLAGRDVVGLEGRQLREDLLVSTLKREARYWRNTARASGLEGALDDRVLRRCVAVATLAGADREAEAAVALEAVPDLVGEGQAALRRRAANWLRNLYPGDRFLRPLEPDRLGEAHVAAVLNDVPELVPELLTRCPEQEKAILTILTRTAREYDSAAHALREVLTERVSSLASLAVEVAQETGEPMGLILADALERKRDPHLAWDIACSLPTHTVALLEVAEVVTRQALGFVLTQEPHDKNAKVAGTLLTDRANRLSNLGRREEALAASHQAVAVYHELAQRDPVVRPKLATALNNLSNRLSALGRHEEALEAIEEAVAIFRELAEAEPEAYEPDLAGTLNDRSIRLSEAGSREEALATLEQAVAIFRRLAQVKPEVYRFHLALALNNRALRLEEVGRENEALEAIDEAIVLFRELAQARPDANRPHLATALVNRSATRFSKLGGREQALAASTEAVEIYRELSLARPEAFRHNLAGALNNLSGRLSECGQSEEALAAMGEAVEIYRDLAAARPAAFQPDLAGKLKNLSNRLSEIGQDEQALAAIDEAVRIYRDLAQDRPAAFRHRLAAALAKGSERLNKVGRGEEALTAAVEAAQIFGELATSQPEAFGASFMTALTIVLQRLVDLGHDDEARELRELYSLP
jgi:tetratricopeptide (TPR) repeat protein